MLRDDNSCNNERKKVFLKNRTIIFCTFKQIQVDKRLDEKEGEGKNEIVDVL